MTKYPVGTKQGRMIDEKKTAAQKLTFRKGGNQDM